MKRHETDVFSLIAGLAFTAIAVVYLIASVNDQSVNGRIVIPVALIALGTAGLAGAVVGMARRNRRSAAPDEVPAKSGAVPDAAPAGPGAAGSPLSDLAPDLEALGLLDDEPGQSPKPRT